MAFNPTSPIRAVTISDLLSLKQLQDALTLWCRGGRAMELCVAVIEPNIEEFNKKLGEQIDPMYLAYALEYTFSIGGIDRYGSSGNDSSDG